MAALVLAHPLAFAQSVATTVFRTVPEGAPGHGEAELPVVAALDADLVTTAVVVVAVLVAVAPGRRHRATVTVMVTLVAGLSVAMADLPAILVAGAVGASVGAVLADVVLAGIRPERAPHRVALPAAVALIAALVWSGQLAGFAVADAVCWPVALWSGVMVVGGLGAAALAAPVARPHLTPPT